MLIKVRRCGFVFEIEFPMEEWVCHTGKKDPALLPFQCISSGWWSSSSGNGIGGRYVIFYSSAYSSFDPSFLLTSTGSSHQCNPAATCSHFRVDRGLLWLHRCEKRELLERIEECVLGWKVVSNRIIKNIKGKNALLERFSHTQS